MIIEDTADYIKLLGMAKRWRNCRFNLAVDIADEGWESR
jgi:hypothetical protein